MTEKERYEQAQHSLNANGPKVGGAGGKRTGPSDPIEDARRKGAASQEQLGAISIDFHCFTNCVTTVFRPFLD